MHIKSGYCILHLTCVICKVSFDLLMEEQTFMQQSNSVIELFIFMCCHHSFHFLAAGLGISTCPDNRALTLFDAILILVCTRSKLRPRNSLLRMHQ